tara:strand:- start:413 stop:1195 length:783 start_codon:yes stop_codon:yes gene_type:complete
MATLEEQIELENRMVQSGIDRYNRGKDDLVSKDLASKTKHGRTIIAGVCEPVADGVKEFMSKPRGRNDRVFALLDGMDNRKIAYISLMCMVDMIAVHRPLTSLARNVGIAIETQRRLDEWLKIDKSTATNLIRMANEKSDKGFDHKRHGLNHKMAKDGIDLPYWSLTDRIRVGVKMIDIIINTTGIVFIRKEYRRNRTVSYVEATADTLEWVKAFNLTHQSALPRYAPCIIPPKDWDSFWGGGYYSKHINEKPFLRVHGI